MRRFIRENATHLSAEGEVDARVAVVLFEAFDAAAEGFDVPDGRLVVLALRLAVERREVEDRLARLRGL